jgi:hypothetical protein
MRFWLRFFRAHHYRLITEMWGRKIVVKSSRCGLSVAAAAILPNACGIGFIQLRKFANDFT